MGDSPEVLRRERAPFLNGRAPFFRQEHFKKSISFSSRLIFQGAIMANFRVPEGNSKGSDFSISTGSGRQIM
ncbi:MAG: hypothetical protein A2Z86_10395 [Candidatus Glassbacteria bacterium GWA2_58_10]|uniref:Uncharacterized protein n=1 Tax=Candidatus Glassbacteria bacterium GWA2_58_10 TaxID=1817865 RepID=A0A1F5YDU2_9BACT|nr:MAG: hypothetical protein A2Z86_10395 [Candidatus Glassbacteria bacterium GWA2_58_10]